MLELNNYVTAGKFFLVIAGELIAIFIVSLFLMLLGFQVTAVYVGVTFLGAMLTAAILSRLGLERDIKPLAAARAGCCCEAKPDKPSAVLQAAPVDGGRPAAGRRGNGGRIASLTPCRFRAKAPSGAFVVCGAAIMAS